LVDEHQRLFTIQKQLVVCIVADDLNQHLTLVLVDARGDLGILYLLFNAGMGGQGAIAYLLGYHHSREGKDPVDRSGEVCKTAQVRFR